MERLLRCHPRRCEIQGFRINRGTKQFRPDVQKLVESSRWPGAGGGKTQSGNVAQEGSGEAGKFYVVQKGDSPAGIAKKFKVSYADLLKANNIEDPKKLQIGQKLVIP